MGELSSILRSLQGGLIAFWCPGCDEAHTVKVVDGAWDWNNDPEKPTFNPSILLTGGHYNPNWKQGDGCWCTYNQEHPGEESSFHCKRCHSYVRDGNIIFLTDCTHALVGQTVPLPPFP